jgi:CRP-like cAMP-binding protein
MRGASGFARRWERPAQRSFLDSLDTAEREAVLASAEKIIFWAGTDLCRQDDATTDVIVITAGLAKVSVASDEHVQIIAVRGSGDVVGERAALTAVGRSATVTALDDVRALVISAARFRALLLEYPHMLEVLKRQEYERLAEDDNGLAAHERADVRRRLAGLLLELALRWGGRQGDGALTITVPMSLQDLADWVDASPDAIADHLRSWHGRGIIRADGGRLTVLDAGGLEKICGVTAIRPAAPSPTPSLFGVTPGLPLNCSIFVTDVAGFGHPRRNDDDRRVVRDNLYRILREAFEGSGVPWGSCLHEDRGDGTLTVVPPTISTMSLIEPLLPLLAARLKRYNRQAGEPVRIQLRAALSVGPVHVDPQGLSGQSLIDAARMLDAPVLKGSLATTGADLAFIASHHVYETVIRHTPGLVDPASYRRVRVQVKESKITGWLYVAEAA